MLTCRFHSFLDAKVDAHEYGARGQGNGRAALELLPLPEGPPLLVEPFERVFLLTLLELAALDAVDVFRPWRPRLCVFLLPELLLEFDARRLFRLIVGDEPDAGR